MKQILSIIGKEDKPQVTDMEEKELNREELVSQKNRIDEKIKKFDRKETEDRVRDSLRKLQDVTESLSDIQNSLNLAWKRTQQIHEELVAVLNLP